MKVAADEVAVGVALGLAPIPLGCWVGDAIFVSPLRDDSNRVGQAT